MIKSKLQQNSEEKVVKIFVNKKGNITLNGSSITLEELDKELMQLKKENGLVYYSRDNLAKDPHKNAMQVIKLVVKHELSIKFFMDKTFEIPIEM